ncbi:MAG: hypothetical protein ABSH50_13255 [Bryobacteraceae bacterium]
MSALLLTLTLAMRPRAVMSIQDWIALAAIRLTASVLAFSWVMPAYIAEGKADIAAFHQNGIAIADCLRNFDLSGMDTPFGSGGMFLLTGALYAPFGGDAMGMFLFSAAIGVSSVVFFMKAAALVWPAPNVRAFGVLIGLAPSLLMWTGIFGKDSWSALGLALWTYAYTMIYARGMKKALGAGFMGFLILVVVRPHIAMLCVLAAVSASAFGGWARARSGWRKSMLFTILAAALVSGALYPVLTSAGLGSLSVGSVLEREEQARAGNSTGGSAIEVQPVTSVTQFLAMLPEAVIRIFARPTVFEAHNRLGMLAGFEAPLVAAALLYILCRPKRLMEAMRRSQLFVFAAIMIGFLCLFMAPVANLGLLVRERAQLLPFLALFFVAAWRRVRRRSTTRTGTPQTGPARRAKLQPREPMIARPARVRVTIR